MTLHRRTLRRRMCRHSCFLFLIGVGAHAHSQDIWRTVTDSEEVSPGGAVVAQPDRNRMLQYFANEEAIDEYTKDADDRELQAQDSNSSTTLAPVQPRRQVFIDQEAVVAVPNVVVGTLRWTRVCDSIKAPLEQTMLAVLKNVGIEPDKRESTCDPFHTDLADARQVDATSRRRLQSGFDDANYFYELEKFSGETNPYASADFDNFVTVTTRFIFFEDESEPDDDGDDENPADEPDAAEKAAKALATRAATVLAEVSAAFITDKLQDKLAENGFEAAHEIFIGAKPKPDVIVEVVETADKDDFGEAVVADEVLLRGFFNISSASQDIKETLDGTSGQAATRNMIISMVGEDIQANNMQIAVSFWAKRYDFSRLSEGWRRLDELHNYVVDYRIKIPSTKEAAAKTHILSYGQNLPQASEDFKQSMLSEQITFTDPKITFISWLQESPFARLEAGIASNSQDVPEDSLSSKRCSGISFLAIMIAIGCVQLSQ